MAINARLDLELDRATGTFAVADTSTRLYIYDGDISLSVGGWTRDEVAIGQDGKTMYEPYLQIVYGGMVLAEAKLNGVEDPPEDEEDYSMTGTLSTNTVQMAAMFCGCVASETMRQFEARIFSTTSANPIATGRVSVWSFPSGGANPVNLPSASEVLAGLRTGLDNHVENENIHVTAQEKAAWTGKQNALTFDNAPTEGSQNPVKSGGVKTALDAEAQARAQNDTTLGNAISAEAAARQEADNELGEDIAEERNRAEGEENRIQGDLNTHKENLTIHVTATDKANWNTKVDPATLLGYVNGGAYDSETRRILLKHDSTTVAWIDATPFIVDGMVESAYITPDGAYLVITFNTDAGKQPINIPLTDIFNPENYYDKTQADALLGNKEDIFTPAEIASPNLVLSVNAVVKNGAQEFVVRIPTTDGLPTPSTSTPLMDGTASAGSSDAYARGDHVHPTDTTRASTADATLNGRGFGEWTWEGTPPTYEGKQIVLRLRDYPFEPGVDGKCWVAFTVDGDQCSVSGDSSTRDDDNTRTTVTIQIDGGVGPYTATRTALPGYVLGPDTSDNPNRDKPLASEAEAEELRTKLDGKLDKSSEVWIVSYTDDGLHIADTAGVYYIDIAPGGVKTNYPDAHNVYWPITRGTLARLEDIAGNFSPSTVYAKDALVERFSLLYRCINPNGHTGAWVDADFAVATIEDILAALRAGKADKPATFTEGHLAALDVSGNPTDSGKSLDDIGQEIQEAIEYAVVVDDGLVPTEGPGTSEVLYNPTSSPTIQTYLSNNYPDWGCSAGPAAAVIARNRNTSEYHVNYDSELYPNMFVFWVQGGDNGEDSSFFTRDVTFPANGVYSVEVTFSPTKTGSTLRYPAVGLSYGDNTLWHYGIQDWSMLQTARFEIKASAGTGTLKFLTENGHSGQICGFVFSHVKVTLVKEIGIEIGDIVAPDASAQTGQAADAAATYVALGGKLDKSAVVAPSTSSSDSGKAADAKATGDALAGKQDALTAQQLANIAALPEVFTITGRINLQTLAISNVDRTYAEVVAARAAGKALRLVLDYSGGNGYCVYGWGADDVSGGYPRFSVVVNLGASIAPYFVYTALHSDNSWNTSAATLATTANVPYDLVTKTIGNGAVTLDDRASNAVAVSSALASLTVNFPTATSGKARDFALRLDLAAGVTAPELAWPQGVTLENEGGEVPEIADGGTSGAATILYFSETAANKFLVKGETLTAIAQA